MASDRGGLRWGHVDDPTAALGAELDLALDQGEERIVAAPANSGAGMEVGTALPHDDLARVDELAAEPFHAEPLGVGVAAVPARRRTLLVCHDCLSSRSR